MTRPSSGVKPIVVSTERPPRTAASDAPAPRWQVTALSSCCEMPDRLDAFHRPHRAREPALVEPSFGDLELAVEEDVVVLVDHAQLERARPGVEDEDAQRVTAARSN